jgi:hypothetical protein
VASEGGAWGARGRPAGRGGESAPPAAGWLAGSVRCRASSPRSWQHCLRPPTDVSTTNDAPIRRQTPDRANGPRGAGEWPWPRVPAAGIDVAAKRAHLTRGLMDCRGRLTDWGAGWVR